MASLYLHIPFCEHKCIYCDFYSVENFQPISSFVDALKREVSNYESLGERRIFDTVFFGGGTPSLLPPPVIREILEHLHASFTIAPDAEITLETNPGTVDSDKLEGFRGAGVNRLSVGIQSFHEDDLRFLTRIHSAAEARQTIHWAQEVGFSNINVDLIFSLPNQTLERWEDTLRQALQLGTQHLSAYSLIVEPSTPLAKMVRARQVTPLSSDADAKLYEFTMQCLSANGFHQYEVSNYAKEGFECRHNLAYWSHTSYLGFGPSAHSFWSGRRWWNIASVQSYCDAIRRGSFPISGEETLSESQLLDEAVMLGLRTSGVDLGRVKEQTGFDLLERKQAVLGDLLNDRLATLEGKTIRLTSRGMLVCDEISQLLLSNLTPA